jgi:phosphoadenosine phosphosulfate reductase
MKVLQFSGGLDSLACLWLLKDMPGLHVLTVSTDGAYPDRSAYLNKVRAALPHIPIAEFHTERNLKAHGIPVDVVPVKFTALGSIVQGAPLKYRTPYECCAEALWAPMHQKCLQLGVTEIFRGQRNDDARKAPIVDGQEVEGITYRFPLATWSRADVVAYVNENCPDLIPESYTLGERTSRDCWDCTGYLDENVQRIKNLPDDKQAVVMGRINEWRADVAAEMGEL